MKKQRVIIDMDEVLADTLAKLVQVMEAETGLKPNREAWHGHELGEAYPQGYGQTVVRLLHRPGFFKDLPVMPDARRVVNELNQRYEVFIVSAAMEFPNSLQDKYDWLMTHFPFLTWHQLALTGSKELVTGDVMIDDRAKNLVPFSGRGLLYHAPHNVHEDRFERVHNWQDIAGILLS